MIPHFKGHFRNLDFSGVMLHSSCIALQYSPDLHFTNLTNKITLNLEHAHCALLRDLHISFD